jgi:hypothetical protein
VHYPTALGEYLTRLQLCNMEMLSKFFQIGAPLPWIE